MSTQLEQLKKAAIQSRRVPLGADQRLMVLQKLQGRLEIDKLFEVFTRELEKQIDINRLIWEHDDISHIVRRGGSSDFRQTFSIKFAQSPLGMLQYSTPYQLDNDEISLIHTYHRLLAGPLSNAIEYSRVRNLAMLDSLTGLNNRTSFEQDLRQSVALTERKNHGLILMIFDMDNFKQVNDTYGHLDGDKVLRRFSLLLKEAIRASDRCYRLGGDEFAVLLTPATRESAQLVNDRLKTLLSHDTLLTAHSISSSVGCSAYRQGDNVTSMFERADRSMYRNKASRRR
ncbi:diguanylate cyclase [Enterovibrio norvegicus FF-33]|uniref:GGDEF domain-containing protein n=1 Tax=Enterovibrio TaxID=188143 RepID=UPI0002F21301|nr:GGDEF domain-containing protein [Enterovibrio norvegicus]OEE68275.1 diguanylate cyclase [Enterovibrio norvegicus FF-33]OEE74303.1 diguanylate cyclase [Enterovibrio norvegicus FF-162]